MPDVGGNALPVCSSMCSVKMEEPIEYTQPEPEAEPGAGTSSSGSDSSESNPSLLPEVLIASIRGNNWHFSV